MGSGQHPPCSAAQFRTRRRPRTQRSQTPDAEETRCVVVETPVEETPTREEHPTAVRRPVRGVPAPMCGEWPAQTINPEESHPGLEERRPIPWTGRPGLAEGMMQTHRSLRWRGHRRGVSEGSGSSGITVNPSFAEKRGAPAAAFTTPQRTIQDPDDSHRHALRGNAAGSASAATSLRLGGQPRPGSICCRLMTGSETCRCFLMSVRTATRANTTPRRLITTRRDLVLSQRGQ